MALQKADVIIPKSLNLFAFDPSPLRRPALTPQWEWAQNYMLHKKYLQRSQFLGFTHFKIVSRKEGGAAEVFRMIFHYAEIAFEDEEVTDIDWKCLIAKMPEANLPVLWLDHNVYGESNAIIRLLGRHLQLMGRNDEEIFIAEAILQQVTDLKESDILQNAFNELQTRPEENVERAFQELLPSIFNSWEYQLGETSGSYFLSSGICLADMAVFDFLHQTRAFLPLDPLVQERHHLCQLYVDVTRHPRLVATYFHHSQRFDDKVLEGIRKMTSAQSMGMASSLAQFGH